MKQSSLGLSNTLKRTRKREFLDAMELGVPWAELVALIDPYAPESGRPGSVPFAVQTLLRIHFMQQWFKLAQCPGHGGSTARRTRIPRLRGPVPLGRTDPQRIKHPALAASAGAPQAGRKETLVTANALLQAKGLQLKAGTVVDATLIAAPSSTKNQSGERDPEMHQSKEGKQWYGTSA